MEQGCNGKRAGVEAVDVGGEGEPTAACEPEGAKGDGAGCVANGDRCKRSDREEKEEQQNKRQRVGEGTGICVPGGLKAVAVREK